MPEYVNEWSSLVRMELQQPFPDSQQPRRSHMFPGFFPLLFKSAAVFLIIVDHSQI